MFHATAVRRGGAIPAATLLLTVWGALLATPARAQLVGDGVADPVHWEATLDEIPPGSGEDWGISGANLVFDGLGGLAVKAADFNDDGVVDVALGTLASVTVHYLEWFNNGFFPSSTIPAEDLGALSKSCYDMDVGDVDLDGHVDIIVGRRGGVGGDSAFMNNGGSGPTWFSDPPIELALPSALNETFGVRLADIDGDDDLDCVAVGKGWGIRIYEWTGGEHGTGGTYVLAEELSDGSVGPNEVYRQLALGDIDGDDDVDVVVPRSGPPIVPSTITVWYNTTSSPGTCPAVSGTGLFVQQDLVAAGATAIAPWPPLEMTATVIGNCNDPTPICPPGCAVITENAAEDSIFEVDLGDLDGDGDPDLVTANAGTWNAAYYNDGCGFFGSTNGSRDGAPGFAFPAVTEDWTGRSPSLAALFGHRTDDPLTTLFDGTTPTSMPIPTPDLEAGCTWEYTVPGAMLNHTTGVDVFDEDGDGVIDLVAFSNRNDWEEELSFILLANLAQLLEQMFPGVPLTDQFPQYTTVDELFDNVGVYMQKEGEVTDPVPPVYDHVFFNRTPALGALAFDDRVELVGGANDGTSYGEFINFDVDPRPGSTPDARVANHAPDWLDANFYNDLQETEAGVYPNTLTWGHVLRARDNDQIDAWAGADPEITFDLRLSVTEDMIAFTDPPPGLDLHVFVLASAVGQYPDPPTWFVDDVPIPMPEDGLEDVIWAEYRGFVQPVGYVPTGNPAAPLHIDLAPEFSRADLTAATAAAGSSDVWFTVLLGYQPGGGPENFDARWISNPLRMPLVLPPPPP